RQLVERVLAEVGAPRQAPAPGVLEYLRDLVERAVARLSDLFGLALGRVALEQVAWWLAGSALVVALGAIGGLLVRRRRGMPAAQPKEKPETASERREDAWDEARWKSELERQLAAGDARGALSALWWWMARALAAERVQPAWTSQELLRHAGRGDLLPIAV